MVYGIKYKLDYCSNSGTPLRLEILKRDYTGVQYNVEGASEPFELRRKDTGSPIIVSEATIQLYEDENFKMEDIYTDDEKEYQVKFFKGAVLEFIGYLLPDIFSKGIGSNPVIKLNANDRIGMLKNIPYQNSNGTPYRGRMPLLSIFLNCLKHTDISLDIKVLIDFVCDEWDPVNPNEPYRQKHFLVDTYHDSSRFSDNSGNVVPVHDVLETTLNLCNAIIYQSEGFWHIFNKRQAILGVGSVFTFNTNGTQVGLAVDYNPEIITIEEIDTGGIEEIAPANAVTQIFSEHGSSFPIPENNTFQDYNAGKYPNWTNRNGYQIENTNVDVYRYSHTGTIIEQGTTEVARPWIRSKVDFIFNPIRPWPLSIETQPYMESSSVIFYPRGFHSLELKIGLKGHYEDPLIVVIVLKTFLLFEGDLIPGNVYLLRGDGSWSKHSEVTRDFIRLSLDKPEGTAEQYPLSVEQDITISTKNLPVLSTDDVYELSLRVYGHELGGSHDRYMLTIQSLSLNIFYENEPKGIVFSAINNGKFTFVPDTILTLFSDKISSGKGSNRPFSAVTRTISSNLFTQSGKLTATWSEPWKSPEEQTKDYLLMLIANQVHSSSATPKRVVSASFSGIDAPMGSLVRFGSL